MRRRHFLSGIILCVPTATSFIATAADAQQISRFRSSVVIGNVTGQASVPSSAFLADLTPRRFRDVLQRALEVADLGASGSSARYRLDAHVEHVDYPSSSFVPLAVTVRAIVRYSMVDLASGETVLDTRADESAVVTRLQVPDELARANAAIRRCAQGTAARVVATLGDPHRLALR